MRLMGLGTGVKNFDPRRPASGRCHRCSRSSPAHNPLSSWRSSSRRSPESDDHQPQALPERGFYSGIIFARSASARCSRDVRERAHRRWVATGKK